MQALLLRLTCPSCQHGILYLTMAYDKTATTDCEQCGHTFNVLDNRMKDTSIADLEITAINDDKKGGWPL